MGIYLQQLIEEDTAEPVAGSAVRTEATLEIIFIFNENNTKMSANQVCDKVVDEFKYVTSATLDKSKKTMTVKATTVEGKEWILKNDIIKFLEKYGSVEDPVEAPPDETEPTEPVEPESTEALAPDENTPPVPSV